MTAAELDVIAGLDVELEVVLAAPDVTEDEFLGEFARVMHEWNFAPFRQGAFRFPTREEARQALAGSRYNRAA
jgi:hypothetical protein